MNNIQKNQQKLATKYQTNISSIPRLNANFVKNSKTNEIESVSVTSTQDDIAQNKTRKFLQSYIFSPKKQNCKNEKFPFTLPSISFPTEISGTTALFPSPSGQKLAVLRQVESENYSLNNQNSKNSGPKPNQITSIEILNKNQFEFCVTSSHLHTKISHSGELGGFVQSPDESKIAYIAEELPKKTQSYFKQNENLDKDQNEENTKQDQKEKNLEESLIEGDQNLYRRDWGAGYVGTVSPKLFLLDLATRKAKKVLGIPSHISVGHIEQSPSGKSIIFVGYLTQNPKFRRLGIRAYNTRPSKLFCVNLDCEVNSKNSYIRVLNTRKNENIFYNPKTQKIEYTQNFDENLNFDHSQSYPKFSPNGKKLVQFSRSSLDKVHYSASRLFVLDQDKEQEQEQDNNSQNEPRLILDTVENPEEIDEFTGLYFYSLPNCIWSEDNIHIFVHSLHRSQNTIYKINTETGKLVRINQNLIPNIRQNLNDAKPEQEEENKAQKQFCGDGNRVSLSLLDVCQNYLLCSLCDPVTPSSIQLCDIQKAFNKNSSLNCQTRVTSLNNLPKCLNDLHYTVLQIEPKSSSKNGVKCGFEAVLVKKKFDKNSQNSKNPLVLELHGGPHGSYPSTFNYHNLTFLSSLGLSMLYVNYRGSLGFGQKSLKSVLGTGQDSNDCLDALDTVLSRFPSIYSANNVGVIGASHGGYLTCMLIGKYPQRFQAAVAHNPVTNIAAMSSMTDIPDWCYIESGIDQSLVNSSKSQATSENYEKMLQNSPLAYVDKVKTPLLMMCGKCDVRVPMLQNLDYMAALERKNFDESEKEEYQKMRTLVYEKGTHGLNDTVEIDGDASINRAMWLIKWLKMPSIDFEEDISK